MTTFNIHGHLLEEINYSLLPDGCRDGSWIVTKNDTPLAIIFKGYDDLKKSDIKELFAFHTQFYITNWYETGNPLIIENDTYDIYFYPKLPTKLGLKYLGYDIASVKTSLLKKRLKEYKELIKKHKKKYQKSKNKELYKKINKYSKFESLVEKELLIREALGITHLSNAGRVIIS